MLTRIIAATVATATLALAAPATAQSAADAARFAQAQARLDRELQVFRQEFDRYAALRGRGGNTGPRYDNRYGQPRLPDPQYDNGGGNDDRDEGDYDPARYYRAGPNYQERVLANDDRVYAGDDGRYYCKRNDGTTGLIVGAAAGGIFGNVIDGGRSRIVGTLLGGAAGALAGKSIDQNGQRVRCR